MIAQLGDSSFMDLCFIKLAASYNAEETPLNNLADLAAMRYPPPEPKSLVGLSLRARS